ncbi:hypothetical protein ACLB1M_18875 [Escherichia coli]
MVNAIESGIGGTLGFLAAVIGLARYWKNDGSIRLRKNWSDTSTLPLAFS